MSAHLQKQIERIADESDDAELSVIVQMHTDDDTQAYVRSTTEAIDNRRAVSSARDLAPPPREKLLAGAAALRRRLTRAERPGAEVFLASEAVPPRGAEDVRAAAQTALEPLLESDWVTGLVDRRRPARRGRRPRPVHFALSGSAVLDLTKDDLRKLPDQGLNIADIFPNRMVKVPPVAKAPELPRVVADNKSYTWGLAKTGALAAWGAFGVRGKGATVAILDTGIDPTHPDLAGKLAGFAEFDANGLLVTDKLEDAHDSDAHGTHCAGIVVGGDERSPGRRLIGMAPHAKVLPVMVLRNGRGTDAQILAGMDWAVRQQGVQVLSLSLGGLRMSAEVVDTYTRTIINANRLGIPVVVAVGNEGSQTGGSPGNDYFAFTVGATDPDDLAAGFSGGRTHVFATSRYIDAQYLPLVYSKPEVSAPGVAIYSAVPGDKWEAWNGTSMATPHVAGAMALLLSDQTLIAAMPAAQRANLLQSLLLSTVKELGESGQNHRFGHGRIDVLRALGYARELGYFP